MKLLDNFIKTTRDRFSCVAFFIGVSVAISTLTRCVLLLISIGSIEKGLFPLAKLLFTGLVYDLIAAFYISIPAVLYLMVLPEAVYHHRVQRYIGAIVLFFTTYTLLFSGVSEFFFWDEFGTRFNFIAVDYLVYTTEVIDNIMESYPVYPLLCAILFLNGGIFVFSRRFRSIYRKPLNVDAIKKRLSHGALFILVPLVSYGVGGHPLGRVSENAFNNELAKNGIYELFAAFRNNSLDYDAMYLRKDPRDMLRRLKTELKTENSVFLSKSPENITRMISAPGEEKRHNVILITVESLSAKYMGIFGNEGGYTPNLDRIAEEGLLFTNFHATGTRTVRGLEAITLSTVPTPGRSIVKRPRNNNLFSLGTVFGNRDYDAKFIYGGYGYFDNMNSFFSGNGFETVDRNNFAEGETTFGNAWGLCDEDLFNKALKEADRSFGENKPFVSLVLTTSNHRPYTYPAGRIDIPPGTGRYGGVKYTDYALGEFFRRAEGKPWFDNTLFVIVADHCGSSAGRSRLPIKKYEIPLIIYNPGLIEPGRVDTLASQIDLAPTLFALLNWRYESRFLGKNILDMKAGDECAFIGNYQKLGMMKGDELVVLMPKREQLSFRFERKNGDLYPISPPKKLLTDAVSYYQSASHLYKRGLNMGVYENR